MSELESGTQSRSEHSHTHRILTTLCAPQRDVLHLYRQIAREANAKNAEDRSTVMQFARGEFQRYVRRLGPTREGSIPALKLAWLLEIATAPLKGSSPLASPLCRYHDVDPKNYQLIEHLVRKGTFFPHCTHNTLLIPEVARRS